MLVWFCKGHMDWSSTMLSKIESSSNLSTQTWIIQSRSRSKFSHHLFCKDEVIMGMNLLRIVLLVPVDHVYVETLRICLIILDGTCNGVFLGVSNCQSELVFQQNHHNHGPNHPWRRNVENRQVKWWVVSSVLFFFKIINYFICIKKFGFEIANFTHTQFRVVFNSSFVNENMRVLFALSYSNRSQDLSPYSKLARL